MIERAIIFWLSVPVWLLLGLFQKKPAARSRQTPVHAQWRTGESVITFPDDGLPTGHIPTMKEIPRS